MKRHKRLSLAVAALALALSIAFAQEIAVFLIEDYQARISPRKGYQCAYARLHGELTCSAYAIKVIREQGTCAGLARMKVRFRQCYQASIATHR